MAVHFDDIELGSEHRSNGRTVTEADIQSFAGLSGDYNPLHTDEQWTVANTPYRGRIAHGLLTLAMGSGLRTPVIDDLHILAYLEVQREMRGVVYPGDTISVVQTIVDLRPSRSRPGSGVVKIRVDTRNQHDELVQTGIDTLLIGGAEERSAE